MVSLLTPPLSVSASSWRAAAELWGWEGGTYQWWYDRGSLLRGRSDRGSTGREQGRAGARPAKLDL